MHSFGFLHVAPLGDTKLPWVHQLMKDTKTRVILPMGEKDDDDDDDDPSQANRRAYLRKIESERKYQRMVSDVEHPRARLDYIPKRQASLSHEIGVGLNILVATLTALFLGWWAGWSYFQNMEKALFVGILCMGGMMIVETILFMGRIRRLDALQKMRKRRKDRAQDRAAKARGPSKEAQEARKALEAWLKTKGIKGP
eukprot:g3883.t1